jgi:hypothetical protein
MQAVPCRVGKPTAMPADMLPCSLLKVYVCCLSTDSVLMAGTGVYMSFVCCSHAVNVTDRLPRVILMSVSKPANEVLNTLAPTIAPLQCACQGEDLP